MITTMVRRLTVKTLDAVVERARDSKRAPVRAVGGVIDKARGAVGLDKIEPSINMPTWTGKVADEPMWPSTQKKLAKWRETHGVKTFDEPGDAAAAAEAQKAEPEVVEPIHEAPIKLYFKRGCPSSRAATELLQEREVEFQAIDVTKDAATLSWLKIVTKRNTTPLVFIHGACVGGFDDLRELDHDGKFMPMVRGEMPPQSPQDMAPTPDPTPEPAPAAEPKGRVKLNVLHPERSPFEEEELPLSEFKAEGERVDDAELIEQVKVVLDECRPMVQADGGDIELLDVKNDIVHLQLTGNCIGCPSAQATLRHGIERRLRAKIPQIRGLMSPQLGPTA